MQFQSLNIGVQQLGVYAGSGTADVQVQTYVSSTADSVGGEAMLPPGARCTILFRGR